MKPAIFHSRARDAIRCFPLEVRREIGKAIYDLQNGEVLKMPLSRTMSSVAAGVEELRLKDQSGSYRVFYYARPLDRIIIFHAFQKKSQATPRFEIEIGRKRLKEVLHAKT